MLSGRNKKIYNNIGGLIYSVFRFLIIIGLGYVIIYPILYMLSVALRNPAELLDPTVVWLPKSISIDNFSEVYKVMEFGSAATRTIVLSLLCTVLQCFTCAFTGYGFARFKFKGRNVLFLMVLIMLIIPPQAIMMPLFGTFIRFTDITGIPMVDTPLPMAVSALFGIGIRSGLFIYIFRQFFKNMPIELEDAAHIDGCGPMAAYFRVMLPNAGAMLLVTFLLTLVWYWNDSFYVSLYYPNARPISILLTNLQSKLNTITKADTTHYLPNEIAAYVQTACLMYIGPILAIYAVLQKKFTQSIVNSGIVG